MQDNNVTPVKTGIQNFFSWLDSQLCGHNMWLPFCLLFVLVSQPVLAQGILAYSKQAYQSMVAIDATQKDFSQDALAKFKNIFYFLGFNDRAMHDIKPKMTDEQFAKLSLAFEELFFLNFERNSVKFTQKKMLSPTYSIWQQKPDFTIVRISGHNPDGPLNFDLYIQKKPDGYFALIDFAVEGVLLSRNYRGSFNRMFREKGYDALLKSCQDKTQELKAKK